MEQIIADAEEEPAIAFAISGGGATGAYEAGVLDAWFRIAQRDHPGKGFLKPRFILGSSAGALNAVTTMVAALRPETGPGFGYEVWKAISPRAAPLVVGRSRTLLVDLATRWLKVPIALIVAVAAALFTGAVLLLTPMYAAAAGAAATLALGLLFRRAVFLNSALTRTVACVLGASVDEKTGRVSRRSLERRIDARKASAEFVDRWYRASAPPNLIVSSTDLTNGEANLFTLVEPAVFARLLGKRWQAMQLMDPLRRVPGYGTGTPADLECGWVAADQFVTCVVASTSIPGVFPSQRITLHGAAGEGEAAHDFVDGGVLNNTPIHIAIDAGATHVVSLELEPLKHVSALQYLAQGDPPSLGRNVVQTFETLLAHSTNEGIRAASSWNRSLVAQESSGAPGKRLVPIYRMAPRRRELNLIDFDGHYESPFSGARPTLLEWLRQGREDAEGKALFWNATFEADPVER
jgi:predicted acylesterase/phospholipase RssA